MALKLELVKAELEQWGEIIVTTAAGERYELHLGDTTFDMEQQIIRLKSSDSHFVIDGTSIEAIEKHYGHRENGDD